MGVDGNLLVGWERSAGLRAPHPPAEGALVANGTGYLLAVGPPAHRLYPGLSSWARWLSALTVPVVAALPFVLVPAPYGLAGVAALGTFVCWLPGAALGLVARARLARRLARAPRWSAAAPDAAYGSRSDASSDASSDAFTGRLVRIEGLVAAQATVPSLFTGRAIVLATSDCAGVVETRGIDFDVRVDGGGLVRVLARDALLLGRGRRVRGRPRCGPLTLGLAHGEPRLRSALLSAEGWVAGLLRHAARELTLGPGDAVEICGVVDLAPDEGVQRGFGRGPALRPVVRPLDDVPVVVRKRERKSVGADGQGAGAASGADVDGSSPIASGTVTSAAP